MEDTGEDPEEVAEDLDDNPREFLPPEDIGEDDGADSAMPLPSVDTVRPAPVPGVRECCWGRAEGDIWPTIAGHSDELPK